MGISAMDWAKGIFYSILASLIGGGSKLAIRKSWLMQARTNRRHSFRSDDSATSADQNLLVDEGPDGETNENIASRNDEARLLDENEHLQNPSFVPYAIRYSGMFGMSVLNPLCCVLAMNYASPSILAPFSGLTLVWIILFSPMVNDEKPSSRQILSCCLIICGEVIVAIFGDHTNDEDVTVEDVKYSYTKPGINIYFLGLAIYVMLMIYLINFSDNFVLRRFAWGCTGGAITGTQNFLKDSLTIIKASNGKWPLLLYLLISLAGISAFVGLLFLTACMKRFDATYASASFVGSFVVSASIMAAVHYDTFAQLSGVLNYVLYPSGIIVLMIGVYLLVKESTDFRQEEIGSIDRERQADINNDEEQDHASQERSLHFA